MLFPLQALLQMLGRNGGALACVSLTHLPSAEQLHTSQSQLDCLLGLAKGNSSASPRQGRKKR